MAKKPETKFKEKVQAYLKTIPELWVEKIQQVSIRGTPDLIICYKGNFVAWELKARAIDKADELQMYKLSLIKGAGGMTKVVHPGNLDESIDELISLDPSKNYINILNNIKKCKN